MPDLYAKASPAPAPRRIPRKCSTCHDRNCRQRGTVCDWKHCGRWTNKIPPPPPANVTLDKPPNPYRTGSSFCKLYDGDWSAMTNVEIAASLGTSIQNVQSMIVQIKRKTGYMVEFKHRHKGGKTYAG